MLEYLYANNFTAAYHAFKADSGTEYTPDPKAKYAGLLEKKWTSVIRLQKKVFNPLSYFSVRPIHHSLDYGLGK